MSPADTEVQGMSETGDPPPDSPESVTATLERIAARANAAGRNVLVPVIPRGGVDSTGGTPPTETPAPSAVDPKLSDSYDVSSATQLLLQAQRRTDVIARRAQGNSSGNDRNKVTNSKGKGQQRHGVLAAAGTWLFGTSAEQRRKEELARQVEEQRRRLRRAIRKTASTDQQESQMCREGRTGPIHHQQQKALQHTRNHHQHRYHHRRHEQGGGICSAITSSAFSLSPRAGEGSSNSSSAVASSEYSTGSYSSTSYLEDNDILDNDAEQLVEAPVDTLGSGFHVNLHMPESSTASASATPIPGIPSIISGKSSSNDATDDFKVNDSDNDDIGRSDKGECGNMSNHHQQHVDLESLDEDDMTIQVAVEAEDNNTKYILNPMQMKAVAMNVLPPSVRYCRWKRLYSLSRDGDSFEAFLRHVQGWKRTLLVVSTSRGETFGAYADSPWENQHHSLGATFYGSAQAALWKIDPKNSHKVVVYKWTGANRYIQICDPQAKLVAFGGGGEQGEFGLCVEDDFRRGSTGPCLTFGNEMLCSQDQFEIVELEFYGFRSIW